MTRGIKTILPIYQKMFVTVKHIDKILLASMYLFCVYKLHMKYRSAQPLNN
jgi:hypothetical protein